MTDAGFIAVIPGFSIHEELGLFVEAGLTPYQALRAATFKAASFAGALDEFGTLRQGRRADLLLLEANPLEDVAHVRQRAGVMVRGRWLSEAELQRRLEELAESFGQSAAAAGQSQAIADQFSVPGHRH
ncbi:MAG TPA: amidohydrolase family protein [Acidobacteriota bacterium]|nr:amidohydrolase family protein [Acidobacteriota bacterium]